MTAVWAGFPQGQIPMCCGNVRISTVYGGTWPASIWRAFMSVATAHMPVREFPTAPAVQYVTLRVDVTQGCLANQYTPPQDIDTFQYVAGSEPTLDTCTEPTSYQELVVPSVIGLLKQTAISALHAAGFNVAVEYAQSDERDDTVIDQDPAGGSHLIQTGTVTITVARGRPEARRRPERRRDGAGGRDGRAAGGRVRGRGRPRAGVRSGRPELRLPARGRVGAAADAARRSPARR